MKIFIHNSLILPELLYYGAHPFLASGYLAPPVYQYRFYDYRSSTFLGQISKLLYTYCLEPKF